MPRDMFDKRKKDVLGKLDKSNIGQWDEKIIPLCKKLNSKKNFYTTSSCAGRVILLIDSEKKAPNLFLYVAHDKINFKNLKKKLNEIIQNIPPQALIDFVSCKRSPTPKKLSVIPKSSSKSLNSKNINFKQEPCGLHIACRNLEDAQILLDKARKAGWKKSGIISSKKRFIIEMFGTNKLEFPIIRNGKILVDDSFLKIIVKTSNKNIEKSWKQIKSLGKVV